MIGNVLPSNYGDQLLYLPNHLHGLVFLLPEGWIPTDDMVPKLKVGTKSKLTILVFFVFFFIETSFFQKTFWGCVLPSSHVLIFCPNPPAQKRTPCGQLAFG